MIRHDSPVPQLRVSPISCHFSHLGWFLSWTIRVSSLLGSLPTQTQQTFQVWSLLLSKGLHFGDLYPQSQRLWGL